MNLPEQVAAACAPLFERIPFEQSMPRLVGDGARETELVEAILAQPAMSLRVRELLEVLRDQSLVLFWIIFVGDVAGFGLSI